MVSVLFAALLSCVMNGPILTLVTPPEWYCEVRSTAEKLNAAERAFSEYSDSPNSTLLIIVRDTAPISNQYLESLSKIRQSVRQSERVVWSLNNPNALELAMNGKLILPNLHLKESQLPNLAVLRKLYPKAIIGGSVHGQRLTDVELDYKLVGTMYPTASHPEKGANVEGLSILSKIHAPPPVIGIGGIDSSNAGPVAQSAEGVAVLGAVFSRPLSEVTDEVRGLVDALNK